jgi:protein-S-isoprenylcysteine O-methyltransferase Ste14
MDSDSIFRLAFFGLLCALLAMRIYFMVRVRRSGGRLMPDEQAAQREGGRYVVLLRGFLFFGLLAFLVMYFLGVGWIEAFAIPLPAWLRWVGFGLGLISVAFWTWAQIHLDTQWSAQLQLQQDHHLVTTGPYAFVRHPLYTALIGWAIAVALLTANWIFVAVCALSILAVMARVPKEEQMMLETFGTEYKAYIQHTGRFFPKF